MNLNQSVQQLYTSSEPWITYIQSIDLTNPFLDSAYVNHILMTDDYFQITIPSQIDVIHNIKVSWSTPIFIVNSGSFAVIKDSFVFNENKPICIRVRLPQMEILPQMELPNLTIEFKATIFKKTVKTKLRSLL